MIIDAENVDTLTRLVEEATRSSHEGVRFFVEPAKGTLARCTTKRHHLIFGRRGSGKTSLLKKAASDLTVSRRPIAFVDLEEFKGHAYPDVLISVLLKSFRKFKEWIDTAAIYPANKISWWKKLFNAQPQTPSLNRAKCKALSDEIAGHIAKLEALLQAPIQSETATKQSNSATKSASAEGHAGVEKGPIKVGGSGKTEAGQATGTSTDKKFVEDKSDTLARNIISYKDIFEKISSVSDGPGFLMLDDLYHIRTSDQPKVIDYFHRIAKNTSIWLKIGTVKHRSRWYINSNPPIGMKLTDDADDIDLDVTLEKFDITKRFLVDILKQFLKEVDLKIDDLLTEGARDRLVLASGGVARDFLSIFRRSIEVTRERIGQGNVSRGEKIGAEDVNMAAGEYDAYKREEFSDDTQDDERGNLTDFLDNVRKFCIDTNNCNCLLVDKDLHDKEAKLVDELVDLKFLHRINPRVTVRNRPGRIFSAFMLDLSQYVGARKQRNLELLEFWRSEKIDDLRKNGLIFLERPWNQ